MTQANAIAIRRSAAKALALARNNPAIFSHVARVAISEFRDTDSVSNDDNPPLRWLR